MTQDMMILEKTMEYIYYIRYDDLGKPMNKLFHSKKLWERVGGGGGESQDEQIHYQKEVNRLNNPIFCKLNYSYSIEL